MAFKEYTDAEKAEINAKLAEVKAANVRMSLSEYSLMAAAWRRDPFPVEGRLNAYGCPACRHVVAVIERDAGVAASMIRCPNCPTHKRIGKITFPQKPCMMISAMYRIPADLTAEMATLEFYRPTHAFYVDIKHAGTAKHIERGGLLLRKIGETLPIGFENSPI